MDGDTDDELDMLGGPTEMLGDTTEMLGVPTECGPQEIEMLGGDAADARAVVDQAAVQVATVRPKKRFSQPAERTPEEHSEMVAIMNEARLRKAAKRKEAEIEHPQAQLADILASRSKTVTSIAKEHGVGRQHVRSAFSCGALSVLEAMRELFAEIREHLSCVRITLGWDTLKFDEASRSLSIDSHPLLLRDQKTSNYDILQSLGRIGWTIAPKGGESYSSEIQVPRMPVVVIGSKNASALWDGLHAQEFSSF